MRDDRLMQERSVKLRVSWCTCDASEQAGPRKCFNETLTVSNFTPAGFAAWRQRLCVKFNRKSLILSYCCPSATDSSCPLIFPLENCSDLILLQAHYDRALKFHTKPSTFRVAVSAKSFDATAHGPSQFVHQGVQTRRQRNSAPPSLAPPDVQDSPIEDTTNDRHRLREDYPSCSSPVNKKMKPHRHRSQLSPTATPCQVTQTNDLSPQPDICWESILRSIAKTIDKHHFSSKMKSIDATALQ
ncbi:hypothetical protein CEUSTIGMA_g670.t1 [Chlamydomonas eustigma]|uniref:Uncharacterized protein n=1 Tax=Chlamydomonas eustigma TaxID=1157962 RepID=A0A250WQV2_9CHLO|nr:hypothetical protein CEUSTIGMA_g670.t1 [Chlamydomonas eustigma]|eukprot:GAX73217.1 hypothetical protein CEUSTIGMA_g670.t1 [Chlamydomonas eustigma]